MLTSSLCSVTIVLQGFMSCLQVASLLSGSDSQTTQAQKLLMLRNQGLLKFVEQDYKGASSGSVSNTSYRLLLSPADWYPGVQSTLTACYMPFSSQT